MPAPYCTTPYRFHTYYRPIHLFTNAGTWCRGERPGEINHFYSREIQTFHCLMLWVHTMNCTHRFSSSVYYPSITLPMTILLTQTRQSPPRPTGWLHPQTDRWEGRRGERRRSLRFLEQVQCLAFGFLHHSLSATLACHFLPGDRGSVDLWQQCLKNYIRYRY